MRFVSVSDVHSETNPAIQFQRELGSHPWRGGWSRGSRVTDKALTPRQGSLAELFENLTQSLDRPAKQGPWVSPAGTLHEGTHRAKGNVASCGLLCLDLDSAPYTATDNLTEPALERAIEALAAAFQPFAFLAYSSWSHGEDKGDGRRARFRVIVPLANPIPGERYADLWRAFAGMLKGADPALAPDEATKHQAAIFYNPVAKPGAWFAADVSAPALDWEVVLASVPQPDPPPPPMPVSAPAVAVAPPPMQRVRPKYFQAALQGEADKLASAPAGRRNATLNSCAWSLGGLEAHGLSRGDAETALEAAWRSLGKEEGEFRSTFASGWETGTRNPRELPESAYTKPRATYPDGRPASGGNDKVDPPQLGHWESAIEANGRRVKWICGPDAWAIFEPGNGWRLAGPFELERATDALLLAGPWGEWDTPKRLCNAKALLTLARNKRATRADEWDADLDTLATPSGFVDLRTGELRPWSPDSLTLKRARVPFDPLASHPDVDRLVEHLTDLGIADYCQRVLGSALAGGPTAKHEFWVFYGEPGAGKSTLLEACEYALGTYSAPVPTGLIATRRDGGPKDKGPELPNQRGRRLAIAHDVAAGIVLETGTIKAWTSGNPISTRLLNSNEQLSIAVRSRLILATNHEPRWELDPGMARRVRVVPFAHKPATDDPGLLDRLKTPAAAAALLAWLWRGFEAYRDAGRMIDLPPCVAKATARAVGSNDPLGEWVMHCADLQGDAWTSTDELFRSARDWFGSERDGSLTPKALGAYLQARGMERTQRRREGIPAWGYVGIRLVPDASQGRERGFPVGTADNRLH